MNITLWLAVLIVLGAMLTVSGWMLAIFLAIQYQILTRITDQRIMSAVLADRIEQQTQNSYNSRSVSVRYTPVPPPVMLPNHTRTALPAWDNDSFGRIHRPSLPVAPVKVPLTQARIDDTSVTETMHMGRASNNRERVVPFDEMVTQRPDNDLEFENNSEDAVIERSSTKPALTMPRPLWYREK